MLPRNFGISITILGFDLRVIVAPSRDEVGSRTAALPINALRVRRTWEDATWPQAACAFFRVRSTIPEILRTVGSQGD